MTVPLIHPIFGTARVATLRRHRIFVNVYEETATGRIWYGVANEERTPSFSSRDRLLYRVAVRKRRALPYTTG